MKLNSLPKTTTRSKKRLGRGYGSGKGGHTATRGAKGQKARNKVHEWFEGGQLPLVKRLPFHRGKGRFKSLKKDPLIVNLKYLNALPKKTRVDAKALVKHGIIREKDAATFPIKILGEGKLEKPLTVLIPTSKSAAQSIKKAGGSVANKPKKSQAKQAKTSSTKKSKLAKKKLPAKKSPAKKSK